MWDVEVSRGRKHDRDVKVILDWRYLGIKEKTYLWIHK